MHGSTPPYGGASFIRCYYVAHLMPSVTPVLSNNTAGYRSGAGKANQQARHTPVVAGAQGSGLLVVESSPVNQRPPKFALASGPDPRHALLRTETCLDDSEKADCSLFPKFAELYPLGSHRLR